MMAIFSLSIYYKNDSISCKIKFPRCGSCLTLAVVRVPRTTITTALVRGTRNKTTATTKFF